MLLIGFVKLFFGNSCYLWEPYLENLKFLPWKSMQMSTICNKVENNIIGSGMKICYSF